MVSLLRSVLLLPVLALAAQGFATATTSPATSSSPAVATGFTLPLYRHHLARRSDETLLREWALREKGRIVGKYGDSPAPAEGSTEEFMPAHVKRATTALGTAGLSTAPLASASAMSSAGAATNATLGANVTSTGFPAAPTSPVGSVKIGNFEADLEYFASVGVGVPPQNMNVILDTGSADLWIASSNCTSLRGCSSLPTLNITNSSTALDMNTTFSVKYGSGSASGEIFQDYVGFGGFNVSSQGFAVCDTVSPGLLSGNISGLMGLGFQTLAASGITPFWQNLFQAGVLPAFPGFAFYLTRFVNVTSAAAVEPGGSLTFGYLNESLFVPPINYVKIPQGMESYWLVPMDAVGVNGTNVTGLGSPMVAIDTGTTLIGGPSSVIKSLYGMVPGALPATGDYVGYYSYPCNASVNVSLTFGGVTYNITLDDFNLGPFGKTNNISTCLGAFFDLTLSSNSKINWVIGAAFLKNVYSVFRAAPPSVGFALLSPSILSNSTIPPVPFNATLPNGGTTYGNGSSNLPNGFFGPSGATSQRPTTVMANTAVVTAIQAGQTPSIGIGPGPGPLPATAVGTAVGWTGMVLGLAGWAAVGLL